MFAVQTEKRAHHKAVLKGPVISGKSIVVLNSYQKTVYRVQGQTIRCGMVYVALTLT